MSLSDLFSEYDVMQRVFDLDGCGDLWFIDELDLLESLMHDRFVEIVRDNFELLNNLQCVSDRRSDEVCEADGSEASIK